MRNKYKLTLFSLTLMLIGIIGCNKLEVEDPVTTGGVGGYVNATITTSHTGDSFKEGESITFDLKIDRTIDHDLDFEFVLLETSVADDHDYEVAGGTIPAYKTEGTLTVTALDELTAEAIEELKFEIKVDVIGERYLLDASQTWPTWTFNIEPPTTLLIQMDWDTEDDLDFVIYKDDAGYPYSDSSDMAATGAATELDNSIDLTETGTYYVGIMNWGASANYTFTFGHPDGTIESITGAFDGANLDKYYIDVWDGWGAPYESYRVLKIVNDGAKFTITQIKELTAADYVDVNTLVGDWSGTDGTYHDTIDFTYPSHVTTYVNDELGSLVIDSLNYEWMQDFWGEAVQTKDSIVLTVYANGDVYIPYQRTWSTIYKEEPYEYMIFGFGTYSAGTLHIEYELDQDGFLVADWAFNNGYSNIPYFVADLTLGTKSANIVDKKTSNFEKPVVKRTIRKDTGKGKK